MQYIISILIISQLISLVSTNTGKIVNFGPKLTEFIEHNPDKSWLIKFYVPWCHHCQQLEPIFINVAERIYHTTDNLIVGRVDCTKYGSVCDKYNVRSYPKIAFFNKNTHVTYKGDRSAKSIIEFVDRLNGPDIQFLKSCNDLQASIESRHLIVLYADMSDKSNLDLFELFKTTATSYKSRYWFYQIKDDKNCRQYKFNTDTNGIYILKKGLNRAIKFDEYEMDNLEQDDEAKTSKTSSLINWIERNSIPIYGPIGSSNIDRYLSHDKSLVIAILDEYRPAKKFSHSSRYFNEQFGNFVQKYVQEKKHENDFIFGFSSDLDLIRSIIIGEVLLPNLMILRNNYTYHLFIQDEKDLIKKTESSLIPAKLELKQLESILLSSTRVNQLIYSGGNSYIYSLMRQIYGQYNIYINMYRANPLLATILVGLPSVILSFVIYTTCFYESSTENDDNHEDEYLLNSKGSDDDDDDDDVDEEDDYDDQKEEEEEQGNLMNIKQQKIINTSHAKQD